LTTSYRHRTAGGFRQDAGSAPLTRIFAPRLTPAEPMAVKPAQVSRPAPFSATRASLYQVRARHLL